ncbi:MAG: GNAT family N-acetyltransferase [Saprospiraceae bacterium]|nr:GNAT family N-acetyltransferase [Saprospiraceae bacterium]
MSTKTTVRAAASQDLAAIFNLVQQLAHFEKAPEQVTSNIEAYHTAFDQRIFNALVAIKESKIVGTAIYTLTWSTWKGRMLYLEDLIVEESARNQGIGQLLFDAFIKEAKELKCALAKWQVLDWNEGAIKFYERNGATIEKEWWNGKITF